MPDGRPHPRPAHVVAVLVARDGAAWLPRTLSALATQSRRPDELLAVDCGSADGTRALLATSVSRVVTTSARAGFCDAVSAALAARDRARLAPREDPRNAAPSGQDAPPQEWVWLLHDDGAPAPDALERLLDAVEVAPRVAIAGCKHRSWDDGTRLLQTGFTASRLGRPLTGVEAGEVDQGQTDHREDVLAVGTAGMLVRRDVWESLGGGDPALPLLGDDLDLCRRARLAGHRVVVVPGAVVAHADATRAGRRTAPALARGTAWATRRHAAYRRLAWEPALLLPLVVAGLLLGGIGRALARTAAKQPGRAGAELLAVLAALARPDRVWRARRAAARTAVLPRRALRPLLAGRREVTRWHRDRWQRRRAARQTVLEPVVEPRSGERRTAAAVVLALAAVALVALHRLVGPGAVHGGALAPAPADLGSLWASARSSWTASGLGATGPADPFLTVLAALALPFAGSPALAVTALLLAAVPLAGLGAWVAAGAATRSWWLRGWAAVTWAAAPPLTLALGDGRLGPLLAHLALPWAALGVVRTVTAASPRRAWTAAAAGGLALAVAATAAPVLLPAGVLALAVVAVATRRHALPLLWTVLPALALTGPRLPALLDDARLLAADPGLPLAAAPAPAWQLLLGQPAEVPPWPLLPEPAGTWAPLVATGLLAALAVAALLRGGPRGRAVRVAWLVAAVGLLTGVVSSRVVVAADATGTVPGWAGSGVSLLLAGLLAAVLVAGDGLRERMRGYQFGWRQAGGGLLAGLALLGPVAALGAWTWGQLDGDPVVVRGGAPGLPVVATDGAASPDRTRTLVLRAEPDGTVAATVTRQDGERLDATSTLVPADGPGPAPATADPATAALVDAVATLVGGAEDPRPALADLAVGYVLLRDDAVGAAAHPVVTARSLDAVVGLSRAGEVSSGVLWRVAPAGGEGGEAVDRSARVRVLAADGSPQAVLPAGPVGVRAAVPAGEEGRTLVLAERADPGWSASLDGHRLEPALHDGWAQAFALPAAGGDLVVEHRLPWSGAWTLVQAAVLLLTLLLAVPVGAGRRKAAR